MITFLNLPNSKLDYENIRLNMDHVVKYFYDSDEEKITFNLIDGTTHALVLHNIDPKKIMRRLDALTKQIKLQINKTDMK